jgi:hypothetical protein
MYQNIPKIYRHNLYTKINKKKNQTIPGIYSWSKLTLFFHEGRLRGWLYPHIQYRLNFYTSAGYHCKISLITKGWDCFGCQVTATLKAMRRLIDWRELSRTPTSADRSLVFLCQLQLSGIWIESGWLTHTLNSGLDRT